MFGDIAKRYINQTDLWNYLRNKNIFLGGQLMQLKKYWSCFCLDFCCIFSHVPHLFADTFHRKSIWPTGFCLPIKVLRRLGGDTSIQWHHWGSKDQDPKERNFMNFASMASYSCILPAYLDLKRRSSLKLKCAVFVSRWALFFLYIVYLPLLSCGKTIPIWIFLQICRCFVCGTWIFTVTLTRVLAPIPWCQHCVRNISV